MTKALSSYADRSTPPLISEMGSIDGGYRPDRFHDKRNLCLQLPMLKISRKLLSVRFPLKWIYDWLFAVYFMSNYKKFTSQHGLSDFIRNFFISNGLSIHIFALPFITISIFLWYTFIWAYRADRARISCWQYFTAVLLYRAAMLYWLIIWCHESRALDI